MPKDEKRIKKLIYLAEKIKENGDWHWCGLYDPDDYTIYDVFKELVDDELGMSPLITKESLKRDGPIYYWEIEEAKNLRVWEAFL
jgi:hypothetical protein